MTLLREAMVLTNIQRRGSYGVYRVTYREDMKYISANYNKNFMIMDQEANMYGEFRTEKEAITEYKNLLERVTR